MTTYRIMLAVGLINLGLAALMMFLGHAIASLAYDFIAAVFFLVAFYEVNR